MKITDDTNEQSSEALGKICLMPVPTDTTDIPQLRWERFVLGEFLHQAGIANGREQAQRLIDYFGSLSATLHADREAMLLTGFHDEQIITLLATLEHLLAIRDQEILWTGTSIMTPAKLQEYAFTRLKGKAVEQGIALFFDRKWKPLRQMLIYEGSVDQVNIYHSEVMRKALILRASHVATIHNHPTGDPTPSKADILNTQELQRMLIEVKITFMDHIIVGAKEAISFREKRLL